MYANRGLTTPQYFRFYKTERSHFSVKKDVNEDPAVDATDRRYEGIAPLSLMK
jgi:hypothetical protein